MLIWRIILYRKNRGLWTRCQTKPSQNFKSTHPENAAPLSSLYTRSRTHIQPHPGTAGGGWHREAPQHRHLHAAVCGQVLIPHTATNTPPPPQCVHQNAFQTHPCDITPYIGAACSLFIVKEENVCLWRMNVIEILQKSCALMMSWIGREVLHLIDHVIWQV